jgi:hypothetical protein
MALPINPIIHCYEVWPARQALIAGPNIDPNTVTGLHRIVPNILKPGICPLVERAILGKMVEPVFGTARGLIVADQLEAPATLDLVGAMGG